MKHGIAWGALAVAAAAAAAAGFLAGGEAARSKEPRFSQLTLEQMDERQRPLAQRILGFSRVGLGGPYHLMLRSPDATAPMMDLLTHIRFHNSLPDRLGELAILIQARLWRSQVEWHGHYPAARKAGLTEDVLADLKANRRPAHMKPDEAAVYDFCTELFTRHAVSDATFARLRRVLNDRQIVDLTMTGGTYVTVAALLAMAEQNPPPGAPLPFQPGDP